MPAPICKSCQSPKCGNHAACARRKQSAAIVAGQSSVQVWRTIHDSMSPERYDAFLKEIWFMMWLYVGIHAHLTALCAIEDAEERDAQMNRCTKEMSDAYLEFFILATDADAAVREKSWDLGLKIVRS